MKKILIFSFFFFSCQAAGLFGALFTSQAIPSWYSTLDKPSFNPPDWLFGIVWFILYTLMSVSVYLVWQERARKGRVSKALIIFFLQLVLNGAWTPIFFGWRFIGLAFFEIILLWLAILFTIIKFHNINRTAAYILYPYLAWVSFAGLLNFAIWQLN